MRVEEEMKVDLIPLDMKCQYSMKYIEHQQALHEKKYYDYPYITYNKDLLSIPEGVKAEYSSYDEKLKTLSNYRVDFNYLHVAKKDFLIDRLIPDDDIATLETSIMVLRDYLYQTEKLNNCKVKHYINGLMNEVIFKAKTELTEMKAQQKRPLTNLQLATPLYRDYM